MLHLKAVSLSSKSINCSPPGDAEHELSAFLQDSCRAGMLLKASLHSKLPGVPVHVGSASAKWVCFHVSVAEMYQECPITY